MTAGVVTQHIRRALVIVVTKGDAVKCQTLMQYDFVLRYGAIIVDEAHERSINTDVLLGLLKRDAPDKYKKLKVCVTSATIETALFRDFFGEAACLEIPGRMFPVTVRHVSIPDAQSLAAPAVSAVLRILDETAAEKQPDGPAQQYRGGDLLVFLTGQVCELAQVFAFGCVANGQ